MYNEEEIQGIVSQVIEISLDHENDIKRLFKKDKEKEHNLPDYNPVYRRTVELCEEMCIHMDSDKFPYKLFKMKAPNENPEEFEYRKSSYQPVTMPFMDRALTTVNRIWNEANFTITDWKEYSVPEGEQPKDYFEKKYPLYKSKVSFYRSVLTKLKLKDPNAVRAVKPRELPYKDDGDGNLTVDQSELIEPISVIYEADQVILFEDTEYALIELREKSLVEFGSRQVREGRIFEFYDDQNIWRITQVGKKIDWEFQFEIYYSHNIGKLPVSKLRGRPCQKENYLLYESHFMPAIPNLNIALYNSNTLEMSITNDAFPQRWEYVDPCNHEGCEGGWIHADDRKFQCPSCKGTGTTAKHSPMGIKQVFVGDRLTQGAEGLSMPPGGYISPDMTTLQFRHEKYIKDIEQAFAFLNIDVSNSKLQTGQKDTAIGKRIDREELFSFLLLIMNELFDLLEEEIELEGKMRYGLGFEGPKITRPVEFSMRTNDEIIAEIVEGRTAAVPDIIIQKQLKEYCLSRFNTDKEVTKFLDIVFKVDRLITLTQQDIVLQKNTGSVLTWEIILHTSIYTFLEQLMIEKEGFLELEYVQQKQLLEDKAKVKEAEIKAAQPAPTVDKILGIANAKGNNSPENAAA